MILFPSFIDCFRCIGFAEGSPMQSGNRVCELQDGLLEAFVSYQQEGKLSVSRWLLDSNCLSAFCGHTYY